MAEDDLAATLGGIVSRATTPTRPRSYMEEFLRSTVSSPLEMFGVPPMDGVENFRAENPVAGIGSELLGTAVPGIGWFKVTQLGRYAKALEAVNIANRPVLTSAAKEIARWAPLEVGAAASKMAMGEDPINAIEGAGINLGLFGAVGALGGLAKGWAQKTIDENPNRVTGLRIQEKIPDFDLGATFQQQYRQAWNLNQANQEPELKGLLNDYLESLSNIIRGENAPHPKSKMAAKGDFHYVRPMEGGANHLEVSDLFAGGGAATANQGKIVRRFVQGPGEFNTYQDALTAAQSFGLQDDFAGLGQFARQVTFGNHSEARKFFSGVRSNLINVNQDTWIGREASGGLYTVARRKSGVGPANRSDEWLLMKTDKPDYFAPGANQFSNAAVKREAWDPYINLNAPVLARQYGAGTLVDIFDMKMAAPFEAAFGLGRGRVTEAMLNGFKKLGIDLSSTTAGMDNVMNFMRQYVAPGMTQFNRNGLANYVYLNAKRAFDRRAALDQEIMFGKAPAATSSIHSMAYKSRTPQGGADAFLRKADGTDKLTKKDLDILTETNALAQDINYAASKGASPELLQWMQKEAAVNAERYREHNGTLAMTHGPTSNYTPNHDAYKIASTWRGNHRVPVLGDRGAKIAMGTGNSYGEAKKEAEEIMAALKQRNPGLITRMGPGSYSDPVNDVKEIAPKMSRKTRQRQAGMQAELAVRAKNPLTTERIQEYMYEHLKHTGREIAHSSLRYAMQGELRQIGRTDRQAWRELNQRLNDFVGEPTKAVKMQNEATDKLLAPVLGRNSATKIVSVGNKIHHAWTLGMGNLTHPVSNMTTFLQTVFPHVAMVINGTPAAAARYYSWFPIINNQGKKAIGHIGVMDMWKLNWRSLAEMGNPDPLLRKLHEQLAREGVTDPKMLEVAVGQNSSMVKNLKGLLKGGGPNDYIKYGEEISNFLPTISEKWSRNHAATIGYIVGRDLLHIADEARLYNFAREFTQNTMYSYSIADRPRALTGPLGTAFGLFKNWQFHYVAQMMAYAGEGLQRGNWSPFLWQMAGTSAVAGIGGLPLYGVADQFSKLMTDQTLMQNIYSQFGYAPGGGGMVSDMLFYGLPAFLQGSLQASTSSPGADLTKDVSQLFSSVWLDRGAAASRAIGNAIDQWRATGDHPIENKVVQDNLLRAFAPRSIYRGFQAAQSDQLKSLNTGYPITEVLSTTERIAYGLGFNPLYTEKTQRASNELWHNQEKRRALTSALGKAWADALSSADSDNMTKIVNQVVAHQLDISSVIKSAAAIQAKTQTPVMRRQFNPADWSRYTSLGIGSE